MLLAAGAVLLGGSLVAVVALLPLTAVAGVIVIAACLPVLARRCGVPPAQALWVALAGPLVGAHLIAGPHNDAAMIALVVAGLTLITVRPAHPGVQLDAGTLLGLATRRRRCPRPVRGSAGEGDVVQVAIPAAVTARARPARR